MYSTFDDIIFSIVLVFPLTLTMVLLKKHWIDKELKTTFLYSLIAGIGSLVTVRLIYIPIELYMGGSIRSFLSTPRDWYITLIACVGIIGFIEEGIKAFFAHIICFFSKTKGYRSTCVFMSFLGCSLGFSFVENIQYYLYYGPSVVLPRIFISSIAHVGFAIICSFFSIKAFGFVKSPLKTALFFNFGLLIASFLHGFFDYMLFQYSVYVLSGPILAFLSFLIYVTYEIWIVSLRYDIPPVGFLAVCSKCRALTVERIRFCPFCGNRVNRLDVLPTILKEKKTDK